MQARHSVHPSTLTLIAPSGAPSGSGITSVGVGARRFSSLKAKRSRSRRLPTVLKVAGGLTVTAGSIPRNVSPSDNLQALVDSSPAGQAFRLAQGLYRLAQVTPRDGDVFYGEPGAVLNGSRLLTEFYQNLKGANA